MRFGPAVVTTYVSILAVLAVARVEQERDLGSEILSDIENAADCAACEVLLFLLKYSSISSIN